MKKIILISVLIWIIIINLGKLWPLSKGERYYQNLSTWYLLVNNGEWEKAKEIEKKLDNRDIDDFYNKNNDEELKKKLNEIIMKNKKNADDWMEIAIIRYKLKKNDEIFEAIESAYRLDPIREDISKIYFTFQTSQ